MIERLDNVEYQVLDAASKGNYMTSHPYIERAKLLMSAGILVQDDMHGWIHHGMKFTVEGRAYYNEFMTAVQAKHGHEWIKDEQGEVDIFAYESGDYHNGPRCKKCGYGFCHHCSTEFDIPVCTGKKAEEELIRGDYNTEQNDLIYRLSVHLEDVCNAYKADDQEMLAFQVSICGAILEEIKVYQDNYREWLATKRQ